MLPEVEDAIMVRILHTPPLTPLSPSYDNRIARKYSSRTIEHKLENKAALQAELGWMEEPKQPVVCIPSGISDALGGQLLEQVLPGLLELPVGIVVLGRGSKKYGDLFQKLSQDSSHRIAILHDDEESVRRMLAGSDIALFCSENDRETVEMSLRYGCVPVCSESDLVENYNPVQESGNAFVMENPTGWQCFAAIVRALETFKFPYDWRTIQRHAIESMERREALVGKA